MKKRLRILHALLIFAMILTLVVRMSPASMAVSGYSQIVTPNPNVPCEPGWCLKYVDDAFGHSIGGRSTTATNAWNIAQYKHADRDFPSGCYVPIWFSAKYEPAGHVALLCPDGTVYSTSSPANTAYHHSSLDELIRYYSNANPLTYLGWSEDIDGLRVVSRPEIPKPGAPTLTVQSNTNSTDPVEFSWLATSNTTCYDLRILQNDNVIKTFYAIHNTTYSLPLSPGSYSAYLCSVNENIPDWWTKGNTVNFTVTNNPIEQFVKRFYNLCLDREPDAGGLNYWLDKLESGEQTGADISQGFIFSQEFINKNLSNSGFLDVMYQVFFNRVADNEGKSYWLSQIADSKSRLYILAQFVDSTEFSGICNNYGITKGSIDLGDEQIIAFVTRFYRLCLDREPDTVGLNDWVDKLKSGEMTGANLAQGFVFSNEFISKNLSNTEFINVMYRAFFNREADSAGRTYWQNELASSKSRQQVLNGFVASDEFADLCSDYGIDVGAIDLGLGWSSWSEVLPPSGNYITESRIEYRYQDKLTTSSSSSSLSGWDLTGSTITSWTSWSAWQNSPVTATPNRQVQTQTIPAQYKTQYYYEHWKYWNTYSGAYFYKGNASMGGTHYSITIDNDLGVYQQTSDGPDYLWNGLPWFNKTAVQTQTAAAYTQWRYCDAIYTYYFEKWGDWSAWTVGTAPSATDTRRVEFRTMYRYKSNS